MEIDPRTGLWKHPQPYKKPVNQTDEMIEEWSSILEIPPDVLQVEQIWDAERKKAYLAENKHTSFLKNFGEEDG